MTVYRTAAVNVYRLPLELVLLVVLVEFFNHLVDEALTVLSALQMSFLHRDAVGRYGSRVARQRHIFLVDLVSCVRVMRTSGPLLSKVLNACGIDAPIRLIVS